MYTKNIDLKPLVGNVSIKTVSKEEGAEDLQIKGIASAAVKDRVGDIVLPSAFEAAIHTYEANPILLYMHDHKQCEFPVEPVGWRFAGNFKEYFCTLNYISCCRYNRDRPVCFPYRIYCI